MTSAQRVPEARVVPLTSGLTAQASRPEVLVVRSWTVELVNTGVSSTQVVLSNQRATSTGLPQEPSWRFNDFAEFSPGSLFRVEMRYEDSATAEGVEHHGRQPAQLGTWVPMIIARVTGLDFTFPSSGGAALTVRGEDLLSRLKAHPDDDIAWGRSGNPDNERDIAAEILNRAGGGLALAPAVMEQPFPFSRGYRRLHQRKNATYLKFLRERATQLDWELYIDFDDATQANSGVKMRFEPHRSRRLDDPGVADLVWGKNLVDFQPKFEFWRQYTSVRAKGRNPWGGRVDETVDANVIEAYIHPPMALLSSAFVRSMVEDGNATNPKQITVQNLDSDRAKARATAVMMAQARKFLTAQVKTIGNPALRPGIHVKIAGMQAPFDGYYYVEKARHSLDEGGYLTTLTLSRAGYLDPSDYPTAAS